MHQAHHTYRTEVLAWRTHNNLPLYVEYVCEFAEKKFVAGMLCKIIPFLMTQENFLPQRKTAC